MQDAATNSPAYVNIEGVLVKLKVVPLAIVVPGLSKVVLLPILTVQLVKFKVPLFVKTACVLVQSIMLPDVKETVAADAI